MLARDAASGRWGVGSLGSSEGAAARVIHVW